MRFVFRRIDVTAEILSLLRGCRELVLAGADRDDGRAFRQAGLGRALLESCAFEAGQEELRKVLASAPDNLAANRTLADACVRAGRLEDAVQYFAAAAGLSSMVADKSRTGAG